MNVYVALLRGINVGGANKILMADLKALFESLNLSDPTTYLQSGNVVFSTIREDISAIEIDLKLKILEIFGYNIEVFVLSSSTFRDVYKKNFEIARELLDIKIPEATLYIWLEVEDELEFTKKLYKQKNIKVLPGSFLGRNGAGQGYIRIALVENEEKTREVLTRLKDFINE